MTKYGGKICRCLLYLKSEEVMDWGEKVVLLPFLPPGKFSFKEAKRWRNSAA
jgi:hypothetical protein